MLDIYNINYFIMKRTILIFTFAFLVIIAGGFWFANSDIKFALTDLMSFTVIIIVVGLAILFGVRRMMSFKRSEPSEDELSKKIVLKSSSVSFYISIYLWLVIMYFSDKIKMETHTLIGLGISAMALIFALTWVIFNFRGIKDE